MLVRLIPTHITATFPAIVLPMRSLPMPMAHMATVMDTGIRVGSSQGGATVSGLLEFAMIDACFVALLT